MLLKLSKIPINYNLLFNNDANDDKQINTLKNAQIKHPQKVHKLLQKQIR